MNNRSDLVIENNVISEEITHCRQPSEAPPPYTPSDTIHGPTITHQPQIIHQTIIVQRTFKDDPVLIDCPSCHKRVMTHVEFANTQKTHLLAGFICGLTVWCMLCCLAAIPYAVKTFKKPEHYCSNCNYYLGSASKF